jgi:hypothetical protein
MPPESDERTQAATPLSPSGSRPDADAPEAGEVDELHEEIPSGGGTDADAPEAGEVGELREELAQTRQERDTALQKLDSRGRRARWASRIRHFLVGLLVVLFAVLLPLTYVVAWTHYVVLTNRGFERTVVPIGTDPAVTAAVAATLTNQIFTSLNAQQTVANALPPQAGFLAGPITNAAKGYVQDGVTTALQSSQFQALWKQAVDFAHEQLLSVLHGNSKALTTTNGQVVLNLVPLFNAALQNLEDFISGVVGRPVQLPSISGNEIPASACQTIGNALNRPVSSTCGQIPLFPADKLTQAQHLVRVFNGILLLLLILTPLVAAAALWLSRRRRRTLLQLSVAGLLGLVVIRRVVNWLTTTIVNTGQPANKPARRAILTHLFHQYFSISRWLLVGLIVVFVVALVTGPYGWARSLRRVVSHWAREGWNLVGAIAGKARDDRTMGWVRGHLDLLRIAGVALAVLLLIVISVSWIGFLVIAVLLAAYEIGLHRIGRSKLSSPPGTPPLSPPTEPPDENPPGPTEPGAAAPQAV